LKRPRSLERVQVFPLEVFDQGRLEGSLVPEVVYEDRQLFQAGLLRRTPPALACDDLVAPRASFSDQNGFEDSVLTNGSGELGKSFGVDSSTRLHPAGMKVFDGGGVLRRALRRRRSRRKQTIQTAPQPPPSH